MKSVIFAPIILLAGIIFACSHPTRRFSTLENITEKPF